MSGKPVDSGKAPDADDSAGTTEKPQESTKDEGELPTDLNADNAVIESKNGKYTIPFEQLAKSRETAAQAQARVAELEAQLQAASARQQQGQSPTQADATAQAAVTAIEQGADAALFGDFSEEALANGIAQLSRQQMAAVREELRAEILAELAPMRQERHTQAVDSHNGAIYAAHEDADSIVESKEFADWMQGKPEFMRAAFAGVLEKGASKDVISLFDSFKKESGIAVQAADASLTTKAKAALAGATATVPSSISDIPGGRMGATNHLDAIDSMNPAAAMAAVQALSPEQREQYLNRSA